MISGFSGGDVVPLSQDSVADLCTSLVSRSLLLPFFFVFWHLSIVVLLATPLQIFQQISIRY